MKRKVAVGEYLYFIAAVIFVAGAVGWFMNVYKLSECDFVSPYRCEGLRLIGIPVAPLGAITGYMDIGK